MKDTKTIKNISEVETSKVSLLLNNIREMKYLSISWAQTY